MATLSTHVLDTAKGCPAPGVRVRLTHGQATAGEDTTDAAGRIAALGGELPAGTYRLTFEVGGYLEPAAALYHAIHLDVDLDEGHYHLPLLLSPWSCASYRGS
jgi:5-hydroxyisourate hydrolase